MSLKPRHVTCKKRHGAEQRGEYRQAENDRTKVEAAAGVNQWLGKGHFASLWTGRASE